jgi:hypothetical protein
MCEKQLYTPKQWREITKKVEENDHYLLTTFGSFALFTEKEHIDNFNLVLQKTNCIICNEKVHAAYYQWKKDDWYPVCASCF